MKQCCAGLLVLLFAPSLLALNPSACDTATQCGSNAFCSEDDYCMCMSGYFTPGGSATDCRSINDPDPSCFSFSTECVFCGSSYKGPCLKCTSLITSSSECVDTCEQGFQITVIPNSTLSARVCEDSGTQTTSQLPQWAIIVIAVMSGFVILTAIIVLLVLSFTWFNRVSSGQFDVEDTNTSLVAPEPTKTSFDVENIHAAQGEHSTKKDGELDDIDDGDEFFLKLCHLRRHAEVYLSMLNDMRRRLKELPPNAPTAQQYRNVMRDVTRLLYLLNKRSSAIEVPPDGIQLLSWSEQILQRYLTSKENTRRDTTTHLTSRLSAIGDQAETNF